MNDYRINFQLPASPLGPAIRPEPEMTAAQRLRDERMEFEIQDFEAIVKDEIGYIVTEEDCRQIKGKRYLVKLSGTIQSDGTVTLDAPVAAPPAIPQGEWFLSQYAQTRKMMFWIGGQCAYEERNARVGAFSSLEWERLEPIDTTPTSTGWIEHDGGECPVAAGAACEVRLRNGSIHKGRALQTACLQASQWVTSVSCEEVELRELLVKLDIVAYRRLAP